MADPLYTRLEATARRLIDKYGKAAQVEREGAPTGPPHNPQPGAPTTHDCKIADIGYSLTNRNETLILVGDKVGIMSTDIDVVPALTDKLLIDGEVYNFLDVAPLNPGGVTLIYEYHARR